MGQISHKNSEIHLDVSHSRQPLVKGERLVRYDVNTVMLHVWCVSHTTSQITQLGYLYTSEIQMKTCLGRLRARCSPRRARTRQIRMPARAHADARGRPNHGPPGPRPSILPGAHVDRFEIWFGNSPQLDIAGFIARCVRRSLSIPAEILLVAPAAGPLLRCLGDTARIPLLGDAEKILSHRCIPSTATFSKEQNWFGLK